MNEELLPLSQEVIQDIGDTFPTPFYVYDEDAMCTNAKRLYDAFSWAPKFKNYFAVKATPTPGVIQPLVDMGMGLDCSSLPELMLAEKMGVRGEDIMFTSNNTSSS